MTNNCRLQELLLIRGPIFPTNGMIRAQHQPPQPTHSNPFNITPAASTSTPNSNNNRNRTYSSAPTPPKRRYACPKCPYSTDRRDLYTRHENIHRDEKPFRCYVCEKMFNRADHVKKHFLRIHKGIEYDVKLTKRIRGRDYDVNEFASVNQSDKNNNCNSTVLPQHSCHSQMTLNSHSQSHPQSNFSNTQIQITPNCFQSNPIIAELLYKRALSDNNIQIPKIAFNYPNNNNNNNNNNNTININNTDCNISNNNLNAVSSAGKFSQLRYHLEKPIAQQQKLNNNLNNQNSRKQDKFVNHLNNEYRTANAKKVNYKESIVSSHDLVGNSVPATRAQQSNHDRKQSFQSKLSCNDKKIELEEDYQCEYCGCHFIDYPSLHTHTFLLHRYLPDNCSPFKCAICDHRSVSQRAMMKHMTQHTTSSLPLLSNSQLKRRQVIPRSSITTNNKLVQNYLSASTRKSMHSCCSSNRRKQSQPRKIVKSLEVIDDEYMSENISDSEKYCNQNESKMLLSLNTRSKFTCKICHKEFSTYTQLIQHHKFSKH